MGRPSRPIQRAAPGLLAAALLTVGALTAGLVAARAWQAVQASRRGVPAPAARAPLDPAALAAEGLKRLRLGETARGYAILDFAEQRSRREWRVEDALMDRAIASGRWDEAIARADALLRTDGAGVLRPAVFRLLDAMAAQPGPRAALVDRLGLAPPPWWREAYLRRLGAAPAAAGALDLGSAVAVLQGLATSAAPPAPGEYRPILATLVADGRYAEAIGLWRMLSRRADAAAPLRDGAFDREGDDTAFTWRRAVGVGAVSEIARSADGPRLHVDYDGFGAPTLPAQLMVLPPGGYRLAWRERLVGPSRLAWRVRCAGGAPVLADEAALAPAPPTWSDRALTFKIPGASCPAQWVELVAAPGERRVDIDASYAAMRLAPAPAA